MILESVDVVVITKKTILQRYSEGSLEVALEHLKKDNFEFSSIQYAHNEHEKCKENLVRYFDRNHISSVFYNLDELKNNQFPFFEPLQTLQSVFQPRKKIVFSLGGDGTLLHASHYVGKDVTLAGINSCPKHSVGHLCSISPENLEEKLNFLFSNPFKYKKVNRIHVTLMTQNESKKIVLPLALNDVLLCHRHPAATSRYELKLVNKYHPHKNKSQKIQSQLEASEKQLSSGVWISSAAGVTAGISSYHFQKSDWTAPQMFVVCREPYENIENSLKLKHFSLDGSQQNLEFHSRMRQGIVCIDGQDFCENFGFGDIVTLSVSEHGYLQLIN